jgi:hypothetical protein
MACPRQEGHLRKMVGMLMAVEMWVKRDHERMTVSNVSTHRPARFPDSGVSPVAASGRNTRASEHSLEAARLASPDNRPEILDTTDPHCPGGGGGGRRGGQNNEPGDTGIHHT